MYAVIRADGRQHRVTPGERVRLDKREAEVGQSVQLSEVLLLKHSGKTVIGQPLVDGAAVEATVTSHGRGKKIRVYTFKRRKGFSKTKGHRQDFTEVKIERICVGGQALEAEPEEPKAEAAPAKKVRAAKPRKAKAAPAEQAQEPAAPAAEPSEEKSE